MKHNKYCRFCKESFATKGNLNKHMKDKHNSSSPSKAFFNNGKNFISKSLDENDEIQMNKSSTASKVEFVIDSIINDVFNISNKKTLKNNETPSCKQCDTCGKSYRTNFNLKRHQRQTRLETKFNMILNKSKRYWHMLKEYENKLYNM